MKANQSFRQNDDAVSPVIAVILMVAITVVLAATVYVWVSGFGASSSTPAKTMSLTSNGALASNTKTYAVASATSGMRWSDVSFTLNGASAGRDGSGTTSPSYCVALTGSACVANATWDASGTTTGKDAVIAAGQLITF